MVYYKWMLYTYLDVHYELDLSPQDSVALTQICPKLERLLVLVQFNAYRAGPSPKTILGLEMMFRIVTERGCARLTLRRGVDGRDALPGLVRPPRARLSLFDRAVMHSITVALNGKRAHTRGS